MKKGIIFSLIFSVLLNTIFVGSAFAGQINVQAKDSNTTKIVTDNFEGLLSNIWYKEMVNGNYSGSVSNKYSKSGKSSYRIELRKTDALVQGSKRSEIRLENEQALQEHTYTFNILLPNGGDEDYKLDPNGSEIIAQWHNTPDANEEWTTPPLALRTKNGHYIIERCWDDAAITSDEQMTQKGNRASYDLGSYENDKGKFVEWQFHIKWGWLSTQKPILEVYKNGVKVLDLNGLPNTTNDKVGVYMKLGIYKWDWAQNDKNDTSILTKRVIYYDAVTVK